MGDPGNYAIAGTRYNALPANPDYVYTATADGGLLIEQTGNGDAHSHTLTMNAVANHTHSLASVSIIPPYKAVYFIMKVA